MAFFFFNQPDEINQSLPHHFKYLQVHSNLFLHRVREKNRGREFICFRMMLDVKEKGFECVFVLNSQDRMSQRFFFVISQSGACMQIQFLKATNVSHQTFFSPFLLILLCLKDYVSRSSLCPDLDSLSFSNFQTYLRNTNLSSFVLLRTCVCFRTSEGEFLPSVWVYMNIKG